MHYRVVFTKRFSRQYKKLARSGNDKNLIELDKIIEELSAGGVLPEKCHVHKLKGDLQDCFECHVLPDWLLVYRKYEDILILELIATGSHASLFS